MTAILVGVHQAKQRTKVLAVARKFSNRPLGELNACLSQGLPFFEYKLQSPDHEESLPRFKRLLEELEGLGEEVVFVERPWDFKGDFGTAEVERYRVSREFAENLLKSAALDREWQQDLADIEAGDL